MSKTGLAIVGLGLVGLRHAQAILSIDHCELVGIVEPGFDRIDGENPGQFSGVKQFTCINELLGKAKPDGVIIATPTLLHVEHASQCIRTGCPALVEKPVAASVSEATPLIQLAEEKQVPLLTGHHRRYNPLIQKAKHLIDTGAIGDIRAIQAACWLYKPNRYFAEAPWRRLKGAGPISVNLSHDIDLMRHLVGEVISVQACKADSRRGFENEDVAAAVLEFDNATLGTITVSDSIAAPWSWEMTAGENPVYPETSESCYHIGGSTGSLSLPDMRLWRHDSKEPDWWEHIAASGQAYEDADPLVNQIHHFVNVIQGKEEPLVSGLEGLKTLQVIEAIALSAQTGQKIRLE